MKKSLIINGFEAECIPSAYLVAMELRRLAREQAKSAKITVGDVPPIRGEGRVMKGIGKWLLIGASSFFGITVLIWIAKGLVR